MSYPFGAEQNLQCPLQSFSNVAIMLVNQLYDYCTANVKQIVGKQSTLLFFEHLSAECVNVCTSIPGF